MGERTLRRWLTEDGEFNAEYDAARSAMVQVGMRRIQALAGRAAETLEDLLGAKQYPAVRLGAARTVARHPILIFIDDHGEAGNGVTASRPVNMGRTALSGPRCFC